MGTQVKPVPIQAGSVRGFGSVRGHHVWRVGSLSSRAAKVGISKPLNSASSQQQPAAAMMGGPMDEDGCDHLLQGDDMNQIK